MAFLMSINPAITILLQLTAEILTLGFTSPTSILRLAIFPLQFTFWYLAFLNINDYIRANWSQIVAALSFVFFVMNFLEISLLRRWSFEAQGPTSHPPSAKPLPMSNGNPASNSRTPKSSSPKIQDTFLNRLQFGWKSTFSVRDIANPHEQASIPPFSISKPTYIPSRPTFLLQTLLRFTITYLILDLIECLPPPPSAAPFAPALYPIFLRGRDVPGITVEEIATRIGTSFMVWVVTYCLISCVVSFISLVSVGTGLSPVSSWRPLFGSFGEAYTLRGFWGKSWHQLPRKPLNNPAIWVVEDVFGMKKGLVARYLKITITFFLSGILHQIGDLSSQLPLSSSGALQFFTIQALGIILEDTIQHLYHLAGFKSGFWTKAVGFAWVVAFLLFWTSPGWFFPQVYVAMMRSEEEKRAFGRLVPVTVLGRFMDT